MDKKQSVSNLSCLIREMVKAGVRDSKAYLVWAKNNLAFVEGAFEYEAEPGMPPIYALVRPFFHPSLPLVGLNYSQSAHATLYEFPKGWTVPLRLCRGIVFDFDGNLVALPFMKFFNYGEHEETRKFPKEPFSVTEKYDGHLGIIFEYKGELIATTRGDFTSPSSMLALKIVKNYRSGPCGWEVCFPTNLTVLVEIIHPDTKVYVDYSGVDGFRLIGAMNRVSLEDYGDDELKLVARDLSIRKAERLNCSLDELIRKMGDRSIENREGVVVRFQSGLRVKLKFETYIARMVADKLGYVYLMNRLMKGNLQKMLAVLPEEIYGTALRMLGEILLAFSTPGTEKDRWRALYDLLPPEGQTSYFKSVCRRFSRFLMESAAPK